MTSFRLENSASASDHLSTLANPSNPVGVRGRFFALLRRDLVGPHPDLDPDLAREVLAGTKPSTWYPTGFLGPRVKTASERRLAKIVGSDAAQEEVAEDLLETQRASEAVEEGATGKQALMMTARPSASSAPSSLPRWG